MRRDKFGLTIKLSSDTKDYTRLGEPTVVDSQSRPPPEAFGVKTLTWGRSTPTRSRAAWQISSSGVSMTPGVGKTTEFPRVSIQLNCTRWVTWSKTRQVKYR